jgi:hypothetical protein
MTKRTRCGEHLITKIFFSSTKLNIVIIRYKNDTQ